MIPVNRIAAAVLIIFLAVLYSGCLGQSDMAAADRDFAEANRLYRAGHFSEARDKILKLLAHYPENPRLHNNLGNLLLKAGMADEAMAHYKKALEYSPGYVIARANVAMLSLMNGDTDAAFSILSDIEPDYPDHADVQNGLGICELRRGNVEKAVNHFRKAVDIHEGTPMFYNNLAYAYAESDEYLNEAMKSVKEALKDDGENPIFLDTQGWILFKRGVFEGAIASLTSALEQDPKSKTIRSHLVHVYRWLGQSGKAVELISQGAQIGLE